MAKILSDMGYDLILVARRKDKLEKLKKQLNTKSKEIIIWWFINYSLFFLYSFGRSAG